MNGLRAGPPVAVVFVSYRSEALVAPRAGRLLDAGFEVVVADNSGSYDGPGRVVDPGGNVGFGAACNAAIASLDPATAAAILHNPDVDAEPTVLAELASRLGAQERPGLLAPAIQEDEGLRARGFRWPGPVRELALGLLAAGGRDRPSRAQAPPTVAPGVERSDDRFGSAALLAVDLRSFRALGGFDERYFLYAEDMDLWRRMADAGRSVGFAPDLVVRHAAASGSPLAGVDRAVLRWVGVELFVARHGRRGAWALYRAVHLLPAVVAARRGSALGRFVLARWVRLASPATVSERVRERALAAR